MNGTHTFYEEINQRLISLGMRDEGKSITHRNFQAEGDARLSKARNSSSVLIFENASG